MFFSFMISKGRVNLSACKGKHSRRVGVLYKGGQVKRNHLRILTLILIC